VTAPPPEPRPSDGTNGWAVAAFILGILGGTILSMIFAIVALVQMKGRRERGRGLAIAALVVSGVWIAVIASLIAYGISTQGKSVRATELTTGDCVKDAYEGELPMWVKRVRCDRPHFGEVFAVLRLPARAEDCGPKFFDYAPNSPEGPTFRVAVAYPPADAWAKLDRSLVCIAVSRHERWSSVRD
jgi:hypothetical protein